MNAGDRAPTTSGGHEVRLEPPRMTPEFRLMALAASRQAHAPGYEITPPSDTFDWDYLIRLARRHRIVGLVNAGLKNAGVTPPPEAAKLLEDDAKAIAVNELWTAAETLRLQKALRTGGVEPIILKGVAVAMLAFGRLGLRYNHDIDILVRPEDLAAALQILRAENYAGVTNDDPEHPSARLLEQQKDIALAHTSGRGIVELHWRLFDNAELLGSAHPVGEPVQLTANGAIHTLPKDLNLVYLCAHGSEHAWERLKWLLDVHALVSRMTREELLRLYALARAQNVHRAVAQALLLCSRLFGLSIPREVARSRHGPRIRALEALALRTLLGSGDRELTDIRFGSTPKSVSHYLRSDGWSYLKAQMEFDIANVSAAPPPGFLRRLGPFGRVIGWGLHHLTPRKREH